MIGEDEYDSSCNCSCAGCRMHVVPPVPFIGWPDRHGHPGERANKIACEIVGHWRRKYLGRWVSCQRCGEHLSGPEPNWMDWHADGIERLYLGNAIIVGLRDIDIDL